MASTIQTVQATMDLNLPELLAVDLERSSTIFQSKQLTSGVPQPALTDDGSRRRYSVQDRSLSIVIPDIPSRKHHNHLFEASLHSAACQGGTGHLTTAFDDPQQEENASEISTSPSTSSTTTNITRPSTSISLEDQPLPLGGKRLSILNQKGISWFDDNLDDEVDDEPEDTELESYHETVSPNYQLSKPGDTNNSRNMARSSAINSWYMDPAEQPDYYGDLTNTLLADRILNEEHGRLSVFGQISPRQQAGSSLPFIPTLPQINHGSPTRNGSTTAPAPAPTIPLAPAPTISPAPAPTILPAPAPPVLPILAPTLSPALAPTISSTPVPTISSAPAPSIPTTPAPSTETGASSGVNDAEELRAQEQARVLRTVPSRGSIVPGGNLQTHMASTVSQFIQYSPPITDGPTSRMQLPSNIMETLKMSVRSFPATMLMCSSLSVETIRSRARGLKMTRANTIAPVALSELNPNVAKKTMWRVAYSKLAPARSQSVRIGLGPGIGGGDDDPLSGSRPRLNGPLAEREASALPCWIVILNVFPSATKTHCDALYAYIVAYNYLTALNPRAALTGTSRRPELVTKRPDTSRAALNPLQDDRIEPVQRRIPDSATGTAVPHKAATFFGMPNRSTPAMTPYHVTAPPPIPPMPPQEARGRRPRLRSRKSFSSLFKKRSDDTLSDSGHSDDTLVENGGGGGPNRLQRRPLPGSSNPAVPVAASASTTGFSSRPNPAVHADSHLRQTLSQPALAHHRPPRVQTPRAQTPRALPKRLRTPRPEEEEKGEEEDDPTADWATLSQSAAVDDQAGGEEKLRELQELRQGLARCIAQLAATLRLQSGCDDVNFRAYGYGYGGADGDDAENNNNNNNNNNSNSSSSRRKGGGRRRGLVIPPDLQIRIDPLFLRSLCELVRSNEEKLQLLRQ